MSSERHSTLLRHAESSYTINRLNIGQAISILHSEATRKDLPVTPIFKCLITEICSAFHL